MPPQPPIDQPHLQVYSIASAYENLIETLRRRNEASSIQEAAPSSAETVADVPPILPPQQDDSSAMYTFFKNNLSALPGVVFGCVALIAIGFFIVHRRRQTAALSDPTGSISNSKNDAAKEPAAFKKLSSKSLSAPTLITIPPMAMSRVSRLAQPPRVFQDRSHATTFPQDSYRGTPPLLVLSNKVRANQHQAFHQRYDRDNEDGYADSSSGTPSVARSSTNTSKSATTATTPDTNTPTATMKSSRSSSIVAPTPPMSMVHEHIEEMTIIDEMATHTEPQSTTSSRLSVNFSSEVVSPAVERPLSSLGSSLSSVRGLFGEARVYTVRRPWLPQKEDELLLRVGDVVHVVQVFSDSWCEGFVEGVEEVAGIFPMDCLQDAQ
ncbi:hypothetical protein BJ741DRAFT_617201 [Chytriomyces cf. hyalinus JEL632]|nr:hypothetical protein BJ741DRAFT_617201 [Chytriomyces cf. hyalinus JEL632]